MVSGVFYCVYAVFYTSTVNTNLSSLPFLFSMVSCRIGSFCGSDDGDAVGGIFPVGITLASLILDGGDANRKRSTSYARESRER